MIPREIVDVLDYDPATGLFHWKTSPCNNTPAGSRAGKTTRAGYLVISFKGTKYQSHRIAWLIMTGREPIDQIDHKNGDSLDNRWRNLREATPRQNCQNRGPRGLLPKGVTRARGGLFRAQIWTGERKLTLGYFDTPEAANSAYAAAAAQFFGEFARAA